MPEITPTKSAALAMANERRFMQQGYDFLDEMRMLLAAEMLKELGMYNQLQEEFLERFRMARQALMQSVKRHGFEAVQFYPAGKLETELPNPKYNTLLGVVLRVLIDADFSVSVKPETIAIDASEEAETCRTRFSELIGVLARLATVSNNLNRLMAEYLKTERRAKALENVLLPEINQALTSIEEHLERVDQEDAIRSQIAVRGIKRV